MSSLNAPDLIGTSESNVSPPLIDRARIRAIAKCWIVVAAAFYLFDLLGQTKAGLTDGIARPFGDDFVNYWSGAWLAWHGRVGEIYDWMAFHTFQQHLVGPTLQFYHYGYPPVLLVLTAPLAALPYAPALGVWLVSSWYAFYRALRLAASENALLLSLAIPALFINALGGQNGAWTAALLGGGLVLLDRRPGLAGVLFGLLIYKPHLGLMLPIALVAGQRWRVIVIAGMTAGVLTVCSLALFGWSIWGDYSHNLSILRQVILEDGTGVWHRMMSVFVFARRLGFGIGAAYAMQITTGVIAAAFVGWAWMRDVSPPVRNTMVVIGTCLATPYLQDYDFVVGAFVVVWLQICREELGLTLRANQIVQASILLLPFMTASFGKLTGYVLGPVVLGTVFAIFARTLIRKPQDAATS